MNNKHYYIDQVNVIIDGSLSEVVTITGSGFYEPESVKRMANQMIREHYPQNKITSVILSHTKVSLEEYQNIIGKNPPWLGNIEK